MIDEERPSTDDFSVEDDLTVVEGAEDVEALRQAVEGEREKADRLLANWQRAQADLDNFRKRAEQERSETARYGNAALVLSMLAVVDDLERALASVPGELAEDAWVNGIHLIYRKFKAVLEERGVREIDALGQPFDPHYHEAVLQGEGEEGMVVEEFQKGYMLHDRVLRPTRVKVGGGGEGPTEEERQEEGNG